MQRRRKNQRNQKKDVVQYYNGFELIDEEKKVPANTSIIQKNKFIQSHIEKVKSVPKKKVDSEMIKLLKTIDKRSKDFQYILIINELLKSKKIDDKRIRKITNNKLYNKYKKTIDKELKLN